MTLNAPNTYSIPLYHANDREKCKAFLEDESYLIAHEDKYWLGYGMYFWANKSNAEYWANEKCRKGEAKVVFILKATLSYQEKQLLDLTDSSDIQYIQKIWVNYCEVRQLNKRQSKRPLGEKLNILLDFFSEKLPFRVIKCHGYYPKAKLYKLFDDVYSFFGTNSPIPDDKTKTIYVVKDGSMLSSRQKIKTISKY